MKSFKTVVREETLEVPRMQKWHHWNKEPKLKTAGMSEAGEDNHKWHRSVEIRAAVASVKRRNAHEGPI
jgi:hypothetical protein